MFVEHAKKRAVSAAPWLYQYYKQRRRLRAMRLEAKELTTALQHEDISFAVERVLASKTFRPSQQPQEINSLLQLLIELQPQWLCEIGCYRGGTLFLWSQVANLDSALISLDLAHDPQRVKAYPYFRRGTQRLHLISGNSHEKGTLDQLRHVLKGHQLDFLFIDGDHSYKGVKADYEMYAPLVRSGGLIALHDIMPDSETRSGIKTNSYTGGVPQYWQELKQEHPNDVREFIQDPDQDGFGIGAIRKR